MYRYCHSLCCLTLRALFSCVCSATQARRGLAWQRLASLQVLRGLTSDPGLLYALFTSYDASIHHDTNAVQDTLAAALAITRVRREQQQLQLHWPALPHCRPLRHTI
jgi:hypothetical protein